MVDRNITPANDERMEAHQATIENIEIEINLKDASVASDAEVRILQAAQRHHRDAICALEELRDRAESGEQS